MSDPKRTSDPPRKRKRRRKRKKKPEPQPDRHLHAPSQVDTERPADEPLAPAEIAEMRRHLAFMREFRSSLRLKLNAKEDLLVNGAKAPDHRGTCKYLLSKVDRAAIAGAVDREPLKSDLASRVRFLAGGASITGNLGILLRYLEALTTVDRSGQAARTFATTVSTIEFDGISAARMSMLLEVLRKAFPAEEQAGVLFGLLQSANFRRAFDACASELQETVARLFVPLRAVDQALSRSGPKRRRRGGPQRPRLPRDPDLEEGLRQMLAAPETLRGYEGRTRERLLEIALRLDADWPPANAGVTTLLESFAPDSAVFRRNALECATRLVRLGLDIPARELLARMPRTGPGADRAATLSTQLDRPRLGRFAFARKPPRDGATPLGPAFWLDPLAPVLVRLGSRDDREVLAREARLQAELGLPGIAEVLDSGATGKGRPYVAVSGDQRLDVLLRARPKPASLAEAQALALQGARILRAVALAGLSLPDASPERFVCVVGEPSDDKPGQVDLTTTRLLLADFQGARETSPEEAARVLAPTVVRWCHTALSYPPFRGTSLRRELPDTLCEILDRARDDPPSPRALVVLLAEQTRPGRDHASAH